MEGYWWSGKFYAIVSAIVAGESAWVCIVLAYRAGETGLEETGTSVEDYGGRLASWHWRRGGVVDNTDGYFRHVECVSVFEEKEEEDKERRKEEVQSI
jgi:hypothetical protein